MGERPRLRGQRGALSRRGVTLVHHGRVGGNARKRKTKLTDAALTSMLTPSAPRDSSLAVADETADELEERLSEVRPAIALPIVVRPPQASKAHEVRVFSCVDYAFGYAICGNCRSDQAYYIHREDMVEGYTFRCRICRHEVTVSS